MTVGTDILDWSGSGETRDFAEGFDAGEAAFAGVGDNIVPVLTAHDFNCTRLIDFSNSAHAIDDDGTFETFVMTKGVSTVTENKGGEMILTGEAVGVGNFFGAFNFDNVASDTAEAHSSKT